MTFNYLTLAGLTTTLFCSLAAALVLKKNQKSIAYTLWALVSTFISLWGMGLFFAFLFTDYETVLFWSRFLNISAIFIPVLFLHFSLAYVGLEKSRKKTIGFGYSITFLFALSCLLFPSLFVKDIAPKEWFSWYPEPGFLYYFFPALFTVFVSLGVYYLYKKYLAAENVKEKNQFKYLFLATAIGLFGGGTTFFLVFNIPIFPFGANGLMFMVLLLSYAITKHDLMDMSVVITKSVAILLTGFLVVSSTLLIFSLSLSIDAVMWPLIFFSMLFWGFYGQSILKRIQTTAEKKFLTGGQYNADIVIANISKNLLSVQDHWHALHIIASEFKDAMELGTVYMLYPVSEGRVEKNGFFRIPISNDKVCDPIEENHPLIQFFLDKNTVTTYKDLPASVRHNLTDWKLGQHAVFIPIHSLMELQGIVILGQKLSEDRFIERDLIFLEAIMNQVIVVFDRIAHQQKLKLVNEQLQFANEELHKKEKLLEERVETETWQKDKALNAAHELAHQASFSTLTLGIAHEIRNPLSAMQGKATTLIERLMGEQQLFGGLEDTKFCWGDIKVSKESLETLVEFDQDYTQDIWDFLLKGGFINQSGQFDETKFRPYSPRFKCQLPEHLESYQPYILKYLLHTYLRAKIIDTLEMFDSESQRVERISSSMMAYGKSEVGVSPKEFSELLGEQESQAIWEDLISHEYLDHKGMVLDKFKPNDPDFELKLNAKYQSLAPMVISLIQRNDNAQKTSISCKDFILKVVDLYEGKFRRKNIHIIFEMQDGLPPIVGHQEGLKRAFGNLFTNAIQAMESVPNREHHFIIRTALTVFPDNPEKKAIEIQFEDTGCGISKEDLSRIMDPFFTKKSVTGGVNLGLGLSFVQGTVQRLGGQILVESEFGHWTRFRLFFPLDVR